MDITEEQWQDLVRKIELLAKATDIRFRQVDAQMDDLRNPIVHTMVRVEDIATHLGLPAGPNCAHESAEREPESQTD